ncbi:hypothetical protein FACS1894110_12360 [Spirochaetia bacterium]|nr:hypothetical protein FACS1894110_12360 [Spirochaetia bacterium]
MKFTWDKRKNKANIKKHGVSFEQAVLVFDDEMLLDRYDTRHILIGNAGGRILYVVATEIDQDTTRIISARYTSKQEKEDYYGYGNLYFGNRSQTH